VLFWWHKQVKSESAADETSIFHSISHLTAIEDKIGQLLSRPTPIDVYLQLLIVSADGADVDLMSTGNLQPLVVPSALVLLCGRQWC